MVNRKHLSQNVAFGLFRLLSLSVVGILFAILGFIIYKGIESSIGSSSLRLLPTV